MLHLMMMFYRLKLLFPGMYEIKQKENRNKFLFSFKMIVEAAPDYAVDIPLIWQYIGEIVGMSIFREKKQNIFI